MGEKMYFDFTPDPKVLIALSHTAMAPLDALCELIDNAIDSFGIAKLQGEPVAHPMVYVDIPKKSDITNGISVLRVRDNGPGMTPEQAEHAIKAGYSGNNSYDSLGLFGMGFNISTSKFGRVTRFMTARHSDSFYTQTTIDLEAINESKSFSLEAQKEEKSPNFDQGTIIEISDWWPEGNPNNGFIKKLVQYGDNKIRQELGRRYATILRDKRVSLMVNSIPCEAFEHCVWSSERFVERSGKQIPARFDFDELLGSKRRCGNCRTLIPDSENECPSCHSTSIRTIEERVTGWIGIQRFDDATRYGIDLIRNGRAIRPAEKAAFFEYVDEFKEVTKDYPIDSQYGRIVGEVHLDFVPVDFLKQDFQRSSEEWHKAMSFLRGDSSLQPKKPGAESNKSIVFKLFQGYRKVRECGKTDLYMGFWDPAENKPKRISREIEAEYYQKFLNKEPGYYDDTEWYKLVEEASRPPIEPLITCPECQSQNPKESDVCVVCGYILKGKECINEDCRETIPQSAATCPHCGANQIPVVTKPWQCMICGQNNKPEAEICIACGKPKGTDNPLDEEYLISVSNKDDTLSVDNLSIPLSDGTDTNKIKVETYNSTIPIVDPLTQERYPIIVKKSLDLIRVFLDSTHPIVAGFRIPSEELIASEIAGFLYDIYRAQASKPGHTISTLTWEILNKYWPSVVRNDSSPLRTDCEELLGKIKEKVSAVIDEESSSILYGELSDAQSKEFVAQLLSNRLDLTSVPSLKTSGQFIKYVPDDFVLQIYDFKPALFFNGNVWNVAYDVPNPLISASVLEFTYKQILKEYRNSLETVILFLLYPSSNPFSVQRVESALAFLKSEIGG